MSISFAICPHDTKTNLSFWQERASHIGKVLHQKVDIITFANYQEEQKALNTQNPDLYYASPDMALTLFQKGYLPIGYYPKKVDKIIIVRAKEKQFQKTIKIATTHHKFMYVGLIRSILEYHDYDIIFASSQREALEKVEKEEADIAIVYKDYFQNHSFANLQILDEIATPFHHYLLAAPQFLEKFQNIIPKILEILHMVPVSSEELKGLKHLYEELELLFECVQQSHLLSVFLDFPLLLIFIYQNEILYANERFQKLIKHNNIKQLDIIFDIKTKKQLLQNLKNHTKGSLEITLTTKDGEHKTLLAFTKTIIYKGKEAQAIVAIDITTQKRLENLYRALRQINQMIVGAKNKEEILQKSGEILYDTLGFDEVAIYQGDFTPLFIKGKWRLDPEILKILVKKAKKQPLIIEDVTSTSFLDPKIKKELLNQGVRSLLILPIIYRDKLYALIVALSHETNFISKEYASALKELQGDIVFALQKIDRLRELTLTRAITENSNEWILVTDTKGKIIYANPAVSKISGYKKEEIIGKNPRIFKSNYHPKTFFQELWQTLLEGKIFKAVLVNRRKDGELFYLESTFYPLQLPDKTTLFVSAGTDITKEILMASEVEKYKYYDPLTRLYNMYGFALRSAEAMQRGSFLGMMILIDIRDMSRINATYGKERGDEILKIIGKKLKNSFKEKDIIGRIGGDEFGIFLILEHKEAVRNILERIHAIFDSLDKVNFNGGVAIFPQDGHNFSTLFQKASIALKEAKKEGEDIIHFFNEDFAQEATHFLKAKELVEKAFQKNGFIFFYQPYYHIPTNTIAGAEMLVRIKLDRIYYPIDFIDYLEKSSYLNEFERLAIQKALESIKEFNTSLSVNLSGKNFKNMNFLTFFENTAQDIIDKLTLEITEREIMNDLAIALEHLKRIHRCGAKSALDDFGTGYSSLSYLEKLPMDILKIDISFIREITTNTKKRVIVQTIINLAHELGMKTVAEGVETKEEFDILKKMECDFAQGFYLSKPLPKEEFAKLISYQSGR